MTERKALVAARIGQGKFKERVKDLEKGLRPSGYEWHSKTRSDYPELPAKTKTITCQHSISVSSEHH